MKRSVALKKLLIILLAASALIIGCKKKPTPAPVTYTITATSDVNGTIFPAGVSTVTSGQSETYTVKANDGYSLATLLVDGSPASLNGSAFTFSNVTVNHTISVTFSKLFTITASADSNGTATPATQQVISGGSAFVTLQPATGFHVDSVWVDGIFSQANGGNVFTLNNITANHAIKASFSDALSKDELAAKSSLLDGSWHCVEQEQSFESVSPYRGTTYLQWTLQTISSCKADDYEVYKKADNSYISYVNGTPCGGGYRTDFDITATWSFSPNGSILFLSGIQYTTTSAFVNYSLNSVVEKLTADSLVLISPAIFTGVAVATRRHYAH